MPLIKKFIAPGSIIRSDCWGACDDTEDIELEPGFECIHETINHSEHCVDPVTGVHTNAVEGTWCAVKRMAPVQKRTKKQLQGMLFEFMWRRKNEGNLWNGLIRALQEVRCERDVKEEDDISL